MRKTRDIVLIAHNVRSSHNVGSLLRTAEGLGIKKVYLSGYTPYPKTKTDKRLPHLAEKIDRQISKTALGAEFLIEWEQSNDINPVIGRLRKDGYDVYALEQAPNSVELPVFKPPAKMALIVGREVEGIESEILKEVDSILEIPMSGKKESFNVAQAAAIALYHCTYS